MSESLALAEKALARPRVRVPAATKAHSDCYRAAVQDLAAGVTLTEERLRALVNAARSLAVDDELLAADVAAAREADKLRAVVAKRDEHVTANTKANGELTWFDANAPARRQELVDAVSRSLSAIQLADQAAKKLSDIEKQNPRLFG